MSIARVYNTKKVRKDWVCGKCRQPIKKGVDGRISFSVGFRGREQTRCLRSECSPSQSERESSLLSSIYAAVEDFDVDGRESYEDIDSAVQDVAEACNEVADEYESNPMFEVNSDLQERADMVRSAADALGSWCGSDEDGPDREDYKVEDDHGILVFDENTFNEAREDWIEEIREAAKEAVDNMELT